MLHLFDGFGVELEYMIVSNETLSVLPICDRVIHTVSGTYDSEVEFGEIAWSNELALHVIELKTNGPAKSLTHLHTLFQDHVRRINEILEPFAARLMPTAMHPWMDPQRELKLWPHEYNAVYKSFNRIFDCRGHGWSNLQSVHLNLPYANDEEFARLHSAIRVLLPILPALAASSPFADGKFTGYFDTRLDYYRNNQRKIPSITGQVVPEPVESRGEYEMRILRPMYEAVAPFDTEGILQHEWLNARGAIARFDRQTIEIRLLDVQECPLADLAICTAVTAVLKRLVEEKYSRFDEQQAVSTDALSEIFINVLKNADQAVIHDETYLALFNITDCNRLSAVQLWSKILDGVMPPATATHIETGAPIAKIREEGPLARRIMDRVGSQPSRQQIYEAYGRLCDCLAGGKLFPERPE